MNCETCQELIHDLIDGSISGSDESSLNTHLKQCLDCEGVRQDLASIVGFCRTQRGQYDAPPNEHALWLRIRNVIEAERPGAVVSNSEPRGSFLGRLMGHSWQLSLPQLAASAVAIVLLVSLATVVGLRRWGGYGVQATPTTAVVEDSNVNDRVWQRRQVINYWNERVELNKARWSPQMRETFDRNMKVIDQTVADTLNDLNRNPHDEVSEQMLNEALNDKLALLKEFSDL
ncbi:MAG TPA: zf-HC2 domain-containing protein [Pyrinomonadaceae bacterium]|nr:zf-HC2 domain-containing protein [Pyrinomonadaceae bacterium]